MKLTPINGNTEIEGSEFVYRGITLLVARAGNTEFKKAFREATKPFKDEIDNNRMDEDTSKTVMIECTAKSILVGWTKFKDVTGEKFDYSENNAIELLTDDKDCYEAIVKFSNDIENYITTDKEALVVK